MKKIMFVCHGNICRSPMAEMIFNDMVKEKGLTGLFFAYSSAVSPEEICFGVGNPIDFRAAATLRSHGNTVGDHRATLLKRTDYGKYDIFICMDGSNYRRALDIMGSDPENKISCYCDITGNDVSDPWYSGNFEMAYADIKSGCEKLLELLKK